MVGVGPGQGWFSRDLPRSGETWKRLLLREKGQGFESPQLHRNTRSAGQTGILYEEDGMATRHKLGTSSKFLALSPPGLGRPRPRSGLLAHLFGMETNNARHQTLEPVLSMSELAARLRVSVQTIMTCAARGEARAASGLAVSCASGSARSTPGLCGWRKLGEAHGDDQTTRLMHAHCRQREQRRRQRDSATVEQTPLGLA